MIYNVWTTISNKLQKIYNVEISIAKSKERLFYGKIQSIVEFLLIIK